MNYTKQEISDGYTAREIIEKKLLGESVNTVHKVYYLERIGLLKGFDYAPYLKQRKIKYPKAEIEKLKKMTVEDVTTN